MAVLSRTFFYNILWFGNWAASRSLAATREISVDFFSSGYLDVSVPQVSFHNLWIQLWISRKTGWVSPFGHLRIRALLSAPRSLSQTFTSFIAFYRLGIHHMRLFTWPYNLKQSVFTWSFSRVHRCSNRSLGYILIMYASSLTHVASTPQRISSFKLLRLAQKHKYNSLKLV